MGNESRDDAFKKGTSFAAAGPSEDRAGFHPGHHSPPPNATPRLPRRPHGHGNRATPSHGLCPRAPRAHHQGRRPGIQDLDTTSPEIRRYPNQRHERKGPAFRTPGLPPVPRPNRPAKTGLHRPVLRHRARDELGPAAGRETSMVLLPGARQGQSCCRARDELGPAAGCETSDGPQLGEGQPSTKIADGRPRRRIEGRHRPHTDRPTPERSSRRRERPRPPPWATTTPWQPTSTPSTARGTCHRRIGRGPAGPPPPGSAAAGAATGASHHLRRAGAPPPQGPRPPEPPPRQIWAAPKAAVAGSRARPQPAPATPRRRLQAAPPSPAAAAAPRARAAPPPNPDGPRHPAPRGGRKRPRRRPSWPGFARQHAGAAARGGRSKKGGRAPRARVSPPAALAGAAREGRGWGPLMPSNL